MLLENQSHIHTFFLKMGEFPKQNFQENIEIDQRFFDVSIYINTLMYQCPITIPQRP